MYPLLFTFRERLQVSDRTVEVTAKGRALAFRDAEDEQWWFYGVNPGALAACGSTPDSAYAGFRIAFRNVLLDSANDAQSVAAFDKDVKAFFFQVADETDKEWWAGVEAVRAGKLDLPLSKKKAEDPRGIEIRVVTAPNSLRGGTHGCYDGDGGGGNRTPGIRI